MDMEKYDYRKIIPDLLQWYDENKRSLPWREEKNPYYTWVSEIMLQQTRVEAVKEYFLRFIGALPEVRDLAYAPEEQLLKLWEGLGYYNRVRNLSVAAKTIVEEKGGNFPDTYEEILELKGVGSYTAGAIASIAFGEQVPAVDGNVLRVMKRLAGSYDDIQKAKTKKDMEEQLKPIIPKRAGDFNQAIMDLGAMICIPNGRPLCEECPLAKHCQAKKLGLQQELPVKTKKKGRKIVKKFNTTFIVTDGNSTFMYFKDKKNSSRKIYNLITKKTLSIKEDSQKINLYTNYITIKDPETKELRYYNNNLKLIYKEKI